MALHIYTDGGLNSIKGQHVTGRGLGGQGIVIHDENTEIVYTRSIHYPEVTTSQRMELSAVMNALDAAVYVLNNDREAIRSTNIQIYSDSAYIVNCIKAGWWFNWMVKQNGKWQTSSKADVENQDLWRSILSKTRLTYEAVASKFGPGRPWQRLSNHHDAKVVEESMRNGLNVSFNKVKGHSDNIFNNMADKLATEGKFGKECIFVSDKGFYA